jgi:hypothetical protein
LAGVKLEVVRPIGKGNQEGLRGSCANPKLDKLAMKAIATTRRKGKTGWQVLGLRFKSTIASSLIALGFSSDGSFGNRRYEKNLGRIKTDLLCLSRLVHFSQACAISKTVASLSQSGFSQ